jgi:uncharacterized protein YkwD
MAQLATWLAAGALAQAPLVQTWPGLHCVSLPQAGFRQMPSSQTWGDAHSEGPWQTAVQMELTHTHDPAALQSAADWQLDPASGVLCALPWLQAERAAMAQSAKNEPDNLCIRIPSTLDEYFLRRLEKARRVEDMTLAVKTQCGKLLNSFPPLLRWPLMLLALFALLAQGLPSQQQLEAALREALAASCPKQNVAFDADLTRGCRAFADAAQAGRAQLSGSAVAFYASLESSEPAPLAGVATVEPAARADRAVSDLFPRSCRLNRIGVAAAELPGGRSAVVCALSALHGTDLRPIPGRVEELETVIVAGTLAPELSRPRLFVTHPSGDVEEMGLIASGGEFSTRVMLRETGEHSIEILADGPGGPQVAALRRVFAGVKPPRAPPAEVKMGKGLSGVEAAIAQLRASRGLPALLRDDELDSIAEAHCKEMARLRTFAHVLPTDGSLTDRLRGRGYPYRSAGENIGLSDDAASAHEAIVGSPAHLANLLDPRHRKLGLGQVRGPTPDGGEGLYLTEVLAAPVVNSADPAADVAKLLFAERRKRGLPELARDAALDKVASAEVRAAADAGALKLQGDAAGKALERKSGLESAVAELFVGSAPDEAANSKNLAEPRWKYLGVAAVYASSRTYGSGRLWVVLVYGR